MATKKLLFLLLATLTCFNEVRGGLLSAISVACSCPKDDSLPKPCQEAITPPWPICLFHSTDDIIDVAILMILVNVGVQGKTPLLSKNTSGSGVKRFPLASKVSLLSRVILKQNN
mmetsp:Transcript_1891/g.2621  ORF Transcript_1891/g.2621 Transcript_1891/m.2621 type:complete len:115 (+) Transcript_1891:123-467(+)